MTRALACWISVIGLAVPLMAQTAAPAAKTSAPTLRINSKAVLVDVIVTDRSGKPVTGLKKDAFTVTEQGKPQTISFFEEHTGAPAAAPVEMPKLAPDVFSNFSPFPQPAAVNVLLLDSLNTQIENQSYVHAQALKFLKDMKPGSRMAIFTMGLGLHFVQGFTDDPALLFAALGNKKNNEVQPSVMLKGQEETNAQLTLLGMMSEVEDDQGSTAASPYAIAAATAFFETSDDSRDTDRVLLTMANLQRLATFLNGFPGRKNVIWFTESPSIGGSIGGRGDPQTKQGKNVSSLSESPSMVGRVEPRTDQEWQKTRNMLAAARVALYPVDARGVSTIGLYQANTVMSRQLSEPVQIIGSLGAHSNMLMQDASQRDAQQSMMKEIANDTGGKAFLNMNGFSDVIAKISAESADFYTVSYKPTNAKMDGAYRNIEVKVAGDKFKLSYRRGYVARETDVPGTAMAIRAKAIDKLAAQNPGAIDPLLPFMDLGMPQSQQILYELKIQPVVPKADAAGQQGGQKSAAQGYAVDFAIDLNDLDLKLDSDGLHNGALNVSLIVYDRYGKIISRKDHLVNLSIKPDVYTVFQQTGVQLHAEIAMPKGQYWLRTGVYDQGSHKVGTMEVALSSVVPLLASAK